jgi:uncharacterized membrane protein
MEEQQNAQQQTPSPTPTPPVVDANSLQDAEANKAMAIVGYIIPILFFIPLLSEAKNSPFAKFHANQQLNFLLLIVAAMVISPILFVILIGFLIMPIIWIIEVVLAIMGIINAANGQMKKLPVIGGFTLLK